MQKALLVVDDNQAVGQLMKRRLEMEGYEVFVETSGDHVLDLLKSKSIRVVLLDLELGQQSGLDILRQIKRLDPEMPVIMVTGHYEENAGREAIESGALDYITKPVDFQYLLNILSVQ